MTDTTSAGLREQLDYYCARAGEYDQWWLRQGRYDRGPALNAEWFADIAELTSALEAFRPAGRVLELACGTGIWTAKLAPLASRLTAVDASREMLALNAARVEAPSVRYVEADLFDLRLEEQFDVVFFSFWLSHVPSERFAAFWQTVRTCLAPGGRVFFVDSRREPSSAAIDNPLPETASPTLRRRLNDGREFTIYKLFYDPADLTSRLRELRLRFEIRQTARYFLYGFGGIGDCSTG